MSNGPIFFPPPRATEQSRPHPTPSLHSRQSYPTESDTVTRDGSFDRGGPNTRSCCHDVVCRVNYFPLPRDCIISQHLGRGLAAVRKGGPSDKARSSLGDRGILKSRKFT
ncbi:hypothetical protein AVEN_187453-1 [Araneus ventricosus]|uniref:Uncharacterized protein n=1 Tax=Araneus ventricosus TaxID=182803 RepID=A0A4Y2BU06_ARAVE|nr:hypothetical protein AVEN_187453-1 [Araneus ventricosus]